jgi:DNA-binding NarL/FixJ family response regulator
MELPLLFNYPFMQASKSTKIKIGLVDDHQLFSKSLSLLLSTFEDCEVVIDAVNGKDLQKKMKTLSTVPNIMLIDVSMPVMDGPQTAKWLHLAYPNMRLVALSMNDDEETIINMLKAGCCAYLFKDIHPNDLERALEEVHRVGYYNPAINFQKLMVNKVDPFSILNEKEIEFLKLACSELTYKEVARKMKVSERSIDGYREILFEKLDVQSRTGMVLEAIRRGFVKL